MTKKEKAIKRLIEIIRISKRLGWTHPVTISNVPISYPFMQLSEVEKCMLAMVDDFEFTRMKNWYQEKVDDELMALDIRVSNALKRVGCDVT